MRAAILAAALLAASCTTATDCGRDVPADLRADTYRYVLDRRLVPTRLMPREDQALGLGAGQPFGQLDDARQAAVALRAAGYSACIRERVDPIR